MTSRRDFLKAMGASVAGVALSGLNGAMAAPLTSKEWASAKKD